MGVYTEVAPEPTITLHLDTGELGSLKSMLVNDSKKCFKEVNKYILDFASFGSARNGHCSKASFPKS